MPYSMYIHGEPSITCPEYFIDLHSYQSLSVVYGVIISPNATAKVMNNNIER